MEELSEIVALFLEIVLIILFYYWLYKFIKKGFRNFNVHLFNKNDKEYLYNSYYRNNYVKKEYLLTNSEKFFYKVLKDIVKDKDILIQTQVVLYDIIQPNKNKYYYYYFDKIKAKSIDYVLVDKNFKILLCIELDDYTHKKTNRAKRDIFINKIFSEANVKLLRIEEDLYYNLDRIKEIIENKIKESI